MDLVLELGEWVLKPREKSLPYLDHVEVFELAGEVQRGGADLVLRGRHGPEAQEQFEGLFIAMAAGTDVKKTRLIPKPHPDYTNVQKNSH